MATIEEEEKEAKDFSPDERDTLDDSTDEEIDETPKTNSNTDFTSKAVAAGKTAAGIPSTSTEDIEKKYIGSDIADEVTAQLKRLGPKGGPLFFIAQLLGAIFRFIILPGVGYLKASMGSKQCHLCGKRPLYDYYRCLHCQKNECIYCEICFDTYQRPFKSGQSIDNLQVPKGKELHNKGHNFGHHENAVHAFKVVVATWLVAATFKFLFL